MLNDTDIQLEPEHFEWKQTTIKAAVIRLSSGSYQPLDSREERKPRSERDLFINPVWATWLTQEKLIQSHTHRTDMQTSVFRSVPTCAHTHTHTHTHTPVGRVLKCVNTSFYSKESIVKFWAWFWYILWIIIHLLYIWTRFCCRSTGPSYLHYIS